MDLEAGPRATVLVGQNGEGKTNTLEALYFAATLKPLRGARVAELVQFGQSAAEVMATYELPGGPREFGVRVEGSERETSVDGKRVTGLQDYFGQVVVVAFTPDDLSLIKGAPDTRRRFLDRAVFERAPVYLKENRDYTRALKARNRLLRDGGSDSVREAFDAQLARLGAKQWRRRLDLVAEIQPHAARAFAAVGRLEAPLTLQYRTAGVEVDAQGDEEALTRCLAEGLEQKLPMDRERRYTSVGPHADDLQVSLGGKAARTFASQGQQRAIVLALKIGEIENLRAHLDEYPLLLLDDVSSELDPERNGFLMRYLRALNSQVILSTTDPALVATAGGEDTVTYRVSQGTLSRQGT